MEEEGIINRVAQSGIVSIDLEDLIPYRDSKAVDIAEQLFQGLILKEADFLFANFPLFS